MTTYKPAPKSPLARLRSQWGFGPRFAVDAILQVARVYGEASESTTRQRKGATP